MKARWALVAIAATTAIVAGASKIAETQPAPEGIWGCVYNSSAPTLTNRQTVQLQCDVNGQLKTG